jgi:acyl-homoserine lactone acylase PvdQ
MDTAGQSGHPGSEHYCGQLKAWLNRDYHPLPLSRADIVAVQQLVLHPSRENA